MKFFKKRSVAVVVLVLAILTSCAYGLYKKPADQLNVQYGTWLLDGAGVLSADTEQTIGDYNQKWDSSYRAVIAVASTDDIHGWTVEKYAKTLGKRLGARRKRHAPAHREGWGLLCRPRRHDQPEPD